MDPIYWALILTIAGLVLLVGELLLPTHGVLGVIGGGSLLAAVAFIFAIDQWLGLAAFVILLIATPFVWSWAIALWPKTPVGKRLLLPPVQATVEPTELPPLGQIGRTVSELRPIGECDFEDRRVEAVSDHGLIPPGAAVKVVGYDVGRPRVRPVDAGGA